MLVETKVYSTEYVDLVAINGIIHGKFKKKLLDLEMAKSMISYRISVSEGKTYPAFIDVRKIKKVTKEARRLFGSKEGSQLLSASALYVDSPITAFLANFLIKVNLREKFIEVKLFSDKDKALEWLETFK